MDVFKSFRTHFNTYEIDNQVSSYVFVKLEKMGKTELKYIPHKQDNIGSNII